MQIRRGKPRPGADRHNAGLQIACEMSVSAVLKSSQQNAHHARHAMTKSICSRQHASHNMPRTPCTVRRATKPTHAQHTVIERPCDERDRLPCCHVWGSGRRRHTSPTWSMAAALEPPRISCSALVRFSATSSHKQACICILMHASRDAILYGTNLRVLNFRGIRCGEDSEDGRATDPTQRTARPRRRRLTRALW